MTSSWERGHGLLRVDHVSRRKLWRMAIPLLMNLSLEPIVLHPLQKVGRDRITRGRADHRVDSTPGAKSGRTGFVFDNPLFDLRRRELLYAKETATFIALLDLFPVVRTVLVGNNVCGKLASTFSVGRHVV